MDDRFIICKNRLYGAINRRGEVVIKPTFEYIGRYREGVAAFKERSRWGFIDRMGGMVLRPDFLSNSNEGSYFSSGLARIYESGRQHFIRIDGILADPVGFTFATHFKSGFSVVQKRPGSEFFIINTSFEEVASFQAAEVPDIPEWPADWKIFTCFTSVNGKWLVGGFNFRGHSVFKPRFEFMTDFHMGVAGFGVADSQSKGFVYGLINLDGTVRVEPKWNRISPFAGGFAVAATNPKRNGYINLFGEWVIEPEFEGATPFFEGVACVRRNKKWGFIDQKGGIVIPFNFDGEGYFAGGMAAMLLEGQFVYIDKEGAIVWREDS